MDKSPAYQLGYRRKDIATEGAPARSLESKEPNPDKVKLAMHKFKKGKLKTPNGKAVKNKKQAIAIALSEARRKDGNASGDCGCNNSCGCNSCGGGCNNSCGCNSCQNNNSCGCNSCGGGCNKAPTPQVGLTPDWNDTVKRPYKNRDSADAYKALRRSKVNQDALAETLHGALRTLAVVKRF